MHFFNISLALLFMNFNQIFPISNKNIMLFFAKKGDPLGLFSTPVIRNAVIQM